MKHQNNSIIEEIISGNIMATREIKRSIMDTNKYTQKRVTKAAIAKPRHTCDKK